MNNSHVCFYKNRAKDAIELRRRRSERNISLRKNKRDEQIQSKRKLLCDKFDDDLIDLQEIVRTSISDEYSVRYQAVRSARKLLSDGENPPIDDLIESNFIKVLIDCLTIDQHPEIQFEAAWVLTNIASGTSRQTKAVDDVNAIPYLVRLLYSNHSNVYQQSLWAIANIIGESAKFRDKAVEHGLITALLNLFRQQHSFEFLRNIAWLVANLCRHVEPPISLDVVRQILPIFIYFLSNTDRMILLDTTWALAYLLSNGRSAIEIILNCDIFRLILNLLNHDDLEIVTAAVRAVGNIATGSDEHTQFLLDRGVLNLVGKCLKIANSRLNRETIWFLSNVTAGNRQQNQAVIDSGLMIEVIQHLENSEVRIQKEGIWCISNTIAVGSTDQIKYLVDHRIVNVICRLIFQHEIELIQLSLESLYKILEKFDQRKVKKQIERCGGLYKIEDLQAHKNRQISRLAEELVEQFFGDESSAGENEENFCDRTAPSEFNE